MALFNNNTSGFKKINLIWAQFDAILADFQNDIRLIEFNNFFK